MSKHEQLIDEARERTSASRLGKSTMREMDKDIVMIGRLIDALEDAEARNGRCGCTDCTAWRREHSGLTDHDRTELARVLHENVYSPGATFDRAVPGIQEYMRECADKVALALPWMAAEPQGESASEVPSWDTRVQKLREAVAGQTGSYLSIEGAEAILETVSPNWRGEPSDAQLDAACAEIAARMNYKVPHMVRGSRSQ